MTSDAHRRARAIFSSERLVQTGKLPPTGLTSTATQAAVYIQAPAAEIGTASGLERTATYIGAITSTSLLGIMYGQHATDHACITSPWSWGR